MVIIQGFGQAYADFLKEFYEEKALFAPNREGIVFRMRCS